MEPPDEPANAPETTIDPIIAGGSPDEPIDTVVLAGGINRIPLFEGYTPGYKALVPFGGAPAIEIVLRALAAVPRIRRIGIVGPEPELDPVLRGIERGGRPLDPRYLPPGETILESILQGIRSFASAPAVLFATADLPLLSAGTVLRFLDAAARVETPWAENLYISVVPRAAYGGPYETFPKPFNRYRDVSICHGNLALVDPRIAGNETAMKRINAIYAARKSPVGSAMAIGLRVGLSYVVGVHLLHLLSLDRMARIASRRFGIGIHPVSIPCPEVTIDVDEPADYAFVTALLREGACPGDCPARTAR